MRLPDRVLSSALACLLLPAAAAGQDTDTFASRVASLSEPGGYFDTDNLISNERSYLHVMPQLEALSREADRNGVYLGVGPDQNFSYIARLRPKMAILIDIRRDNLLLHLLFKALFEKARTRADYLAMLTGRAVPSDSSAWSSKPADAVVSLVDHAPPMSAAQVNRLRETLTETIRRYGVRLENRDLATIDRFHRRFIDAGLSLRFNTTGQAPRFSYPTYRDLLLEVDRNGRRCSFVATEDDFLFVKRLQAKHQVIPIVGDLSGPRALTAVAKLLTAERQQVTAFYTSNVEFYLFGDGSFPLWVANLARLPHQPGSVIIRSIFPGGTGVAPLPGYNSLSTTQSIDALLDGYAKGKFQRYAGLMR